MDAKVCFEHGTVMLRGSGERGPAFYCPTPGCAEGSITGAITTPNGIFRRVLPRGGAYHWKILRSKGRCIPCERARQAG